MAELGEGERERGGERLRRGEGLRARVRTRILDLRFERGAPHPDPLPGVPGRGKRKEHRKREERE
jgi:hypothetical protein